MIIVNADFSKILKKLNRLKNKKIEAFKIYYNVS